MSHNLEIIGPTSGPERRNEDYRMFDLLSLKRMLQGLEGHRKSLAEEKTALMAKRNTVMNAPAARSDVKAMFVRWVDSTGAGFAAAIERDVAEFIRQPNSMGNKRVAQVVSLVDAPFAAGLNVGFTRMGEAASQIQVDRALCALFAPQIKAALAAAVDAMEWPGVEGLPLAQRLTEVDKLDRQIEKLAREELDLEEQAGSAGVRL